MLCDVGCSRDSRSCAAARLYTTSSYHKFNDPLRAQANPHPFRCSVYLLWKALKKLRSVTAVTDKRGFAQDQWLWRGLKNKRVDRRAALVGGTELALMSTTLDKAVALRYCQDEPNPLLLKLKSGGLGRGCSIQYLSVFPGEKEIVFPPLIYLKPEQPPYKDRSGVTVWEVSPQGI